MKTLRTLMTDNVGQMKESLADEDIKRLKNQDGRDWRKDYSDFMYVEDESDDDMINPCALSDGCVWVTCTPKQ